MKISLIKYFSLVSVLFFFMFSAIASAELLGSDINVNVSPENPRSNQDVYVTLESFATSLDTAQITWTLNGKVMKTGRGEKSFNFTTGSINTTTTLSITIKTSLGETVQRVIKIKPASVDLLWESDSFTPPFYKGKSLFSYQNHITYIAIPHITNSAGQEIGAKNLVYKWSKNGSVIENASGYGKDTYSLFGPLLYRPMDIEVTVTSAGSESVGYGSLTVNATEPSVVFYKNDPLYGIEFQKAMVGTIDLSSQEVAVVGMPYFFGTSAPDSGELSYKWKINGKLIDGDFGQTTRVFRPKEGTSGTSNISLSVENSNKILQLATSNFYLKFGKSENAN